MTQNLSFEKLLEATKDTATPLVLPTPDFKEKVKAYTTELLARQAAARESTATVGAKPTILQGTLSLLSEAKDNPEITLRELAVMVCQAIVSDLDRYEYSLQHDKSGKRIVMSPYYTYSFVSPLGDEYFKVMGHPIIGGWCPLVLPHDYTPSQFDDYWLMLHDNVTTLSQIIDNILGMKP
jgi:hypothetical protein